MLQTSDYFIILCVVVAAVFAIVYYWGRRNQRKSFEAQDLLEHYKMVTPILVIDKKYARPKLDNMPKSYYESISKKSRLRKMCIIKAKVGPQITTLFCDKNVYDVLVPKKTYKVELSGALILGIQGMNLADKKNKTLREKITVRGQGGSSSQD